MMTFFWICAVLWLISFVFGVIALINWNKDMARGELYGKWEKVSNVSFAIMIVFTVIINVLPTLALSESRPPESIRESIKDKKIQIELLEIKLKHKESK